MDDKKHIKDCIGEHMIRLKEITEHSWLVISEVNANVGLMSENQKNEINLLVRGGRTKFNSRDEVCNFFGKDVFKDTIKVVEKKKENYVIGYPADFHNPFPVEHDSGVDLPFYTKTESGTVLHCAGYYVIHFPKGPIHSFCPKYSTLSKYEYEGPFKTELEMKSVLASIKKKSKIESNRQN